jgi:hypothetical protein
MPTSILPKGGSLISSKKENIVQSSESSSPWGKPNRALSDEFKITNSEVKQPYNFSFGTYFSGR